MTLLSCFQIPFGCKIVVHGCAKSLCMVARKIELRIRKTLLLGLHTHNYFSRVTVRLSCT